MTWSNVCCLPGRPAPWMYTSLQNQHFEETPGRPLWFLLIAPGWWDNITTRSRQGTWELAETWKFRVWLVQATEYINNTCPSPTAPHAYNSVSLEFGRFIHPLLPITEQQWDVDRMARSSPSSLHYWYPKRPCAIWWRRVLVLVSCYVAMLAFPGWLVAVESQRVLIWILISTNAQPID